MFLEKKNGIVTKTDKKMPKEKGKLHLCWEDCKNACPNKCEKVSDRFVGINFEIGDSKKKHIGEYDFITDGSQEIDAKGNVKKFVVTGCKNYEKAPEKSSKPTKEEIERLKKAKEYLMLYYFDAATVEEASEIQRNLTRKGQLRKYN